MFPSRGHVSTPSRVNVPHSAEFSSFTTSLRASQRKHPHQPGALVSASPDARVWDQLSSFSPHTSNPEHLRDVLHWALHNFESLVTGQHTPVFEYEIIDSPACYVLNQELLTDIAYANDGCNPDGLEPPSHSPELDHSLAKHAEVKRMCSYVLDPFGLEYDHRYSTFDIPVHALDEYLHHPYNFDPRQLPALLERVRNLKVIPQTTKTFHLHVDPSHVVLSINHFMLPLVSYKNIVAPTSFLPISCALG